MTNAENKNSRISSVTPPESYSVPCIYQELEGHQVSSPIRVSVPGSKSITNRALLLATLAEGTSILRGTLFSDDSRHFISCIQELGFKAQADEAKRQVIVTGCGGGIPKQEASIYVGSAGTAARFLTAFLGVSRGIWHIDASEQMRRRPMAPLFASLQKLGCDILPWSGQNTSPASDVSNEESYNAIDHLPITLCSHGFGTNHITVNIDHSSQFLSALLITSCLANEDFHIQVEGSHGMSYINMTCRMMEHFGVSAVHPQPQLFCTKAAQRYRSLDYRIEPDVSAACYFYAMVPLLHIPVLVEHVHFDSLQGDVAFLRILEEMGCTALDTGEGIILTPPADASFPGVTVDMSSCSDQAITLAAIAPYATTPTSITGIGHIRFQESDRIRAVVTELGKMGIRCDEGSDSITIYPGSPKPSSVSTYDDHRMAMGFSLMGLRTSGILIQDPLCCRKTFEDYFTVLEKTIQDIKNMIE